MLGRNITVEFVANSDPTAALRNNPSGRAPPFEDRERCVTFTSCNLNSALMQQL
jgi:hypothetical protein